MDKRNMVFTAWRMVMILLVAASGACQVAIYNHALAAPPDNANVSAYKKMATEAMVRWNTMLTKNKWRDVRVSIPEEWPSKMVKESGLDPACTELGNARLGVEVVISVESGRVTRLTEYQIQELLIGPDAPLYDQPTKPRWSEERAISVAKEAIETVIGEFPKDAKPSIVKYDHAIRAQTKYYQGTWWVYFARIDNQGNKFREDCACVEVSEQYGPLGLTFRWVSKHTPPATILPRTKELDAKAGEWLGKMRQWEPAKEWFRKFEQVGQPKVSMQVVNPIPTLFEIKSLDGLSSRSDRNARLAWCYTYPMRDAKPTTRITEDGKVETLSLSPGQIEVWLDAETGKFLGGYF